MKNQFYKASKNVATFRINAPKLQGVKTVGYINLFSRSKAEIEVKKRIVKVRIYKTRKALKFSQIASKIYLKARHIKESAQSFLQSCFLESTLNRAKQALQDARRTYLSTSQAFPLYVDVCKAIQALRQFKFSLPKTIRLNLF